MTEASGSVGFSEFDQETITLADRRFLIRRATTTDVPRLVYLLRDDALGAGREGTLRDAHESALRAGREGERSDAEDAAAYQHAFGLIDADPNQLLAAIDDVTNVSQSNHADDQLPATVGTLQLTLIPSLSRRGSTRLQIEAVRIGSDAQGLGLGTAVFDWAHACGRRFGAAIAQLTTDKTRTDAQRFYARLGYEASHEGLKFDLS
ncbi:MULTISPECIES: GNAT family N-acetyltransferase [Brevibacterium]|uniref:Ribosomal protein S18 acetylase RimI n=2 Tax=Brevibacterium TaxID=1696 RepID=A0A1H1U5C8_BRESA|nr:GNAT family N-acetyltransferase [Brevibacterium sandarakinum]SDS67795.1 Ribosomal protein S18 acetylase RimI [Brevibacterium sandarakinum]